MQCVIAGGVVLNPASLLGEIDGLVGPRRQGRREPDDQRPGPRDLPLARRGRPLLDEQCTSGEAIGTTLRGIGPCYRDKVGRSLAVRLGDMYRARLPRADRADHRGEERDVRTASATSGEPLDAAEDFRRNTTATPSG